MRRLSVVVQILLAFVLTASLMPAVLVGLPAAREGALGPALAVGMFALAFGVLRLVWPVRRS